MKKSKRIKSLSIVILLATVLLFLTFCNKSLRDDKPEEETANRYIVEKTIETKSNEAVIIVE
ncbi:hypothetical protein [Candidatus Enterococcus ferrettii]|uniref:Uncharacterized protein n=1 Tax=Candidatus Enterococcus ferrettii TaxID=2815324 RepID=A0ABV0ENL4_9ENTE|nr:hypothetical protein [Enterococcus sp. 665A]MBO1342157.1 hypothetical protein [Enterococcus sp. 665A]